MIAHAHVSVGRNYMLYRPFGGPQREQKLITDRSLTENDLKYTGQLVAQATGINQQSAEERVAATFSTLQTKLADAEKAVKEAADEARKVSAYTSLWLFIALLSGAFIASLMAVYGGRQRDF